MKLLPLWLFVPENLPMSDSTETIRKLDKENRYLKRKLDRLQTQQLRQEKIDEMNRFQAKRANSRLEVARAVAERSNRAKSEFLANMSHEIRTPLNIVLGMAELLDGSKLSAAQKQYLSSLRHSGEHLLKLINNILDFSRIESGSVEIDPEPFHLFRLLRSVEEMGHMLSLKKDIDFTMTIEDGLADGRLGDSAKIKQILINLVNNAVKFTTIGGVHLDVLKVAEGERVGVRFVVTDSGSGIPKEKQDVIFQRFAQVARDPMQERSGVGLGLAISQRLALAMGGEIDFRSREGKGTTFDVYIPLPLVALPADDEQKNLEAQGIQPEQLPPLKILAVDDVGLNLEIIEHFLVNSKVEIDTCNNGREAIRHFSHKKYDLVLMDIRMPVMDGARATRIMRRLERFHQKSAVPIIAMTAHAFREQKKQFLADGFDEIMTKPFSRDTLMRTLLSATRSRPTGACQTGNKVLGAVVERYTQQEPLPQSLADLLPEFLEMVTSSFDTMSRAISERNFSQLGTVCHSMKGVAGMYGFKNLTSLVENIERSATDQNIQSITTLNDSLGYYIAQLKRENLRILRN